MHSLENWHIDSETDIFWNPVQCVRLKCMFWKISEQIPLDLYCLHVLVATESVELGEQYSPSQTSGFS